MKENTGGVRRPQRKVTAKDPEAPPVAKTGKRKAPARCRRPLHVSAVTVREHLIGSQSLKCTLIISNTFISHCLCAFSIYIIVLILKKRCHV